MGYSILLFIAGVLFGVVITHYILTKSSKPSGTFIIDLSDPIKDVCRFEMDESLDSIYSKKKIVLNVKTYAEFSPK